MKRQKVSCLSILSLSYDDLHNIFDFLEEDDLLNLRLVCSFFNDAFFRYEKSASAKFIWTYSKMIRKKEYDEGFIERNYNLSKSLYYTMKFMKWFDEKESMLKNDEDSYDFDSYFPCGLEELSEENIKQFKELKENTKIIDYNYGSSDGHDLSGSEKVIEFKVFDVNYSLNYEQNSESNYIEVTLCLSATLKSGEEDRIVLESSDESGVSAFDDIDFETLEGKLFQMNTNQENVRLYLLNMVRFTC